LSKGNFTRPSRVFEEARPDFGHNFTARETLQGPHGGFEEARPDFVRRLSFLISLRKLSQTWGLSATKANFPKKTEVFSDPLVAYHKCPKGPDPNKKKEKIGTIF
jgi:hypothetical protein